jgi:hypothetical protein
MINLDEIINWTETRVDRLTNDLKKYKKLDLFLNNDYLKKQIKNDTKRLTYLNLGYQMLLHDLNKTERQRTIESREFQEWQIYIKAELQTFKLKRQL